MIATCPQCKTAHSKTEKEIAGGVTFTCRNCSQPFRVGANGKTEPVPAAAAPVAAPIPLGVTPLPASAPAAVPGVAAWSIPVPPGGATAKPDASVPAFTAHPAASTITPPRPETTIPAAPAGTPAPGHSSARPAPSSPTLAALIGEIDQVTANAAKPAAAIASGAPASATVIVPASALAPADVVSMSDPVSIAASASSTESAAASPLPLQGTGGPAAIDDPIEISKAEPLGEPAAPAPAPIAAPKQGEKGQDWGDQPTSLMNYSNLQEHLDQMRTGEGPTSGGPAGGEAHAEPTLSDEVIAERRATAPVGSFHERAARPPFPSATLARFGSELWAFAKGQRPAVRIAALGGTLVIVAGMVWLVVATVGRSVPFAFVMDTQALLAGPMAGEAYTQLATKQRGDRVELYDTFGEFSLVKDAMGRAGYILTRGLREKPPPSVPGQAFADCQRAPIEASLARCQARAQDQFESCRYACTQMPEEPSCVEHCQQRLTDCLGGCEDALPTSTQRPAGSPSTVTPAEETDEPAVEAPPAPKKKTKKSKPKAKRGK